MKKLPRTAKENHMYDNDVSSAFEILLEEVETIIDQLNQDGAKLFSRSSHKEARLILDKAEAAGLFRVKVKDLQKEWTSLESSITRKTAFELRHSRRKKSQRLQRGLRTPEEEYRLPILRALVRLGGKSSSNDVLDEVGKRMRDILNKHDKESLASTPSLPRWRNTGQWARNGLVNEGLLSSNSPKGIWEITEAGRKALPNSEERTGMGKSQPTEDEIPRVLYHILKVCQYVLGGKFNYNEAVAQITKEDQLKSIHTVYDACTRRINLNTAQFRTMLENPHKLSDHLSTLFPKHKEYVGDKLSQLASKEPKGTPSYQTL